MTDAASPRISVEERRLAATDYTGGPDGYERVKCPRPGCPGRGGIRCGYDCPCCEYGDGTAPADHDRNCGLITTVEGDCTCEGAEDRARARKEE